MNTRTHYRNSTPAFQKTVEYATAITRYATPARGDSCVMYTSIFALVFLAVMLIVEAMV